MVSIQSILKFSSRNLWYFVIFMLFFGLFLNNYFFLSIPCALQDPAYNTGKFGEVKELIIGMLDNYNYEEVIHFKHLLLKKVHIDRTDFTILSFRSMRLEDVKVRSFAGFSLSKN